MNLMAVICVAAHRSGKLKSEREGEVAVWLPAGPDSIEDGIVGRWKNLAARVELRFRIVLAKRSVGALLKRLAFRHVSV
ncbi:hypothetical protein JL100_030425 (plasmid) [Skermanella mucosa]|uniref:hypothetical protein n=1 Tax=Skermanella mucosa TaxID=1789672 RepID=UPI001E590B12|nr:hypothetical protein [Skermanella mucosa]UEM24541.1 hypothetical protein JL100_030425 [Skermanella mucosa]